MKSIGFEDFYCECLKDLCDAENQIVKALPKLVKMASTPELKKALEEHLKITEEQARRLDRMLAALNVDVKDAHCKGMKGIISECDETMKKLKGAEPNIIDAAIVACAQKVEHYEICGYGTARTFAKDLGDEEGMRILERTLEEEKKADRELTTIAESAINMKAAAVSGAPGA